uniref:Uncharacterized protein n=1 Tax=Sphaerodactylus townsendi TaxID=933632 RepID=A0ACB8FJU8_9SAUR
MECEQLETPDGNKCRERQSKIVLRGKRQGWGVFQQPWPKWRISEGSAKASIVVDTEESFATILVCAKASAVVDTREPFAAILVCATASVVVDTRESFASVLTCAKMSP